MRTCILAGLSATFALIAYLYGDTYYAAIFLLIAGGVAALPIAA